MTPQGSGTWDDTFLVQVVRGVSGTSRTGMVDACMYLISQRAMAGMIPSPPIPAPLTCSSQP
eukprot:1069680-Rhodomonas_salina.1